MKKSLLGALSILCLILLLFESTLSIEGARFGLILWFQTVIPTLLPFMICSNVIVRLGAARYLVNPLKKPCRRFLHLSECGTYTLVVGLLCGYPMGAKTCGDFVSEKRMEKSEGQYLLAFCNHPSPMFIIGYLAATLLCKDKLPLILLSIYLPILPLAWLSGKCYRIKSASLTGSLPGSGTGPIGGQLDDAIANACEVILKVGVYIILYSILAAFLKALPWTWEIGKLLTLGAIEITTGIQAVGASPLSGSLAALLGVSIAAFGGLSGVSQTQSVIKNAELSIRHYLLWKLLHSLLSAACFLILAYLL